jgi:hypothetical protein
MSSYETCRECDSETGRAGASEDSLYHSYVGPFCEDCYDDWPDKIEAELAKVRREFRDFRAGQAVSVPEWIKCSDRLPAEYDGDFEGLVWVNDRDMLSPVYAQPRVHWSRVRGIAGYTHWMPTGFRRPQPPKQEEGHE